jgi:membrane protein DedA with SNARE-associated domain
LAQGLFRHRFFDVCGKRFSTDSVGIIMPLAGFMAAEDKFSLLGVIVAGTLGSVLGALPFYYLGAKLGEERLKRFAERYGRWFTISPEDIDRADDWFDRHGAKAVLLGRIVPGIRSFISIPAGFNRMNLGSFLLFTTIGSSVWTSLLAGAGYLLGTNFHQIEEYLDVVTYFIFGAIIVVYLWRVFNYKKKH